MFSSWYGGASGKGSLARSLARSSDGAIVTSCSCLARSCEFSSRYWLVSVQGTHSGRKTVAADAVLCETHSHPPCTHHCLNASFPNKTRSRGGSHYIPFFLFILRVWSQPNSCQNFIFQAAFFSRCQPIGVESVAY